MTVSAWAVSVCCDKGHRRSNGVVGNAIELTRQHGRSHVAYALRFQLAVKRRTAAFGIDLFDGFRTQLRFQAGDDDQGDRNAPEVCRWWIYTNAAISTGATKERIRPLTSAIGTACAGQTCLMMGSVESMAVAPAFPTHMAGWRAPSA